MEMHTQSNESQCLFGMHSMNVVFYAMVLTHKYKSAEIHNAYARIFNSVFSFSLSLSRAVVDECKKRWRSLRDAFMKQYKLYSRGDANVKKKWLFYEQMEFLGPYFDK